MAIVGPRGKPPESFTTRGIVLIRPHQALAIIIIVIIIHKDLLLLRLLPLTKRMAPWVI